MLRYFRFICSVAALLTATIAMAEERILSMEEAILSKDIRPKRYSFVWSNTLDHEYYHHDEDKKWHVVNAVTGESREVAGLPATAPAGHPKTVENDLLWYEPDGSFFKITDNSKNKNIVSGSSVSRNEFGIREGYFISPDHKLIAFYEKDESAVTDYPIVDISTRTGTAQFIKYPMIGMPSEKVRLGVYSFEKKTTIFLGVTDFYEERYLTNITWSPDSRFIYIQVLNRAQKNMHLNKYDAATGEFLKTILTEEDPRYVEPQYPLYFIGNSLEKYIYSTNCRDGFWNLYLIDESRNTVERLTQVDADVTYVENDGRRVYYYSAEISPVEQHLFSIDLRTRKVQRLTQDEGWHTCRFSKEKKYFLDNYSSLEVPNVYRIASSDGKFSRIIYVAEEPAKELNYLPIEMGSIKSADGKYDNYYRLIKPKDFSPEKKYPVILYVYGGPHSKMVLNNYRANLRHWEMYMAQRGYVVFVMDNRGTRYQGTEYEKCIHRHCGRAEMEDQMEGMKWLLSQPWTDNTRVGVHGWSYGGFMTISLMVNYPDIFKVGVAGGPVIDWKWYEVMYGERYMDTPETNPEGFQQTSLIEHAKELKGRLLICQGVQDKTVVWQHSLSFISECISNNIPVDYFPYPYAEHNVIGKNRVHLMNKVTQYFEDHLR